MDSAVAEKIRKLSISKLEALTGVLLDFSGRDYLDRWLKEHGEQLQLQRA